MTTSVGAGSESYMNRHIPKEEITSAIASLGNRESVGGNGITAETIQQNQK